MEGGTSTRKLKLSSFWRLKKSLSWHLYSSRPGICVPASDMYTNCCVSSIKGNPDAVPPLQLTFCPAMDELSMDNEINFCSLLLDEIDWRQIRHKVLNRELGILNGFLSGRGVAGCNRQKIFKISCILCYISPAPAAGTVQPFSQPN